MKWVQGQSGNPKGRPKRGRTITDLLQQRLDKEQFVRDLIALAHGGEGIDPAHQISAMRLILGYTEGLPLARAEVDPGEGIQITVTYVQQNNRLEFAGAPSGATADDSECLTLQRGLLRAPVGQDSAWDGPADSSGLKG